MMVERSYVDYLRDALDAIEKASQFAKGMDFDEFSEDDKTVVRSTHP